VFLLVALVGLILDLGTKSWIFSQLWPPTSDKPAYLWLWKGHIGLQVSLNQGAVFGIGQGWVFWFALLSVLAVGGILYWLFVLGEAKDWWLTIALGGITAGIFGNLYDRLGLHGLRWPEGLVGSDLPGSPIYAVRDWILLQWNDAWRWPNFNIADSLLVVGAILLLWHAYATKSKPNLDTQVPESRDEETVQTREEKL
jgi:signal peptidase II